MIGYSYKSESVTAVYSILSVATGKIIDFCDPRALKEKVLDKLFFKRIHD